MFEKRWECVACGAAYRARPSACGACGGTLFDPVGAAVEPRVSAVEASTGSGSGDPTWTCERCGRVHEFEPVTCVACGAASFAYAGPPREPWDNEVPPGFPTSPEAVRRDAAAREYDDPVSPREIAVVVFVCLAFLAGLVALGFV